MSTLPAELISIVSKYLSGNDFAECMRVCTTWYTLLTPRLFRNIEIKDSDQLVLLIEAIRTYPSIQAQLPYVQSMLSRCKVAEVVTEEQTYTLCDILVYCPYIEVLRLPYNMPLLLTQLVNTTHVLQNIKAILLGHELAIPLQRPFFELNYAHRATLERFFIPASYHREIIRLYNGILHYLSLFPAISELMIYFNTSPILLFDILHQCPTLTHINYRVISHKEVLLGESTDSDLVSLRLHVHSLLIPDVLEINHRLKKLCELDVSLAMCQDPSALIDAIMGIRHLHTVRIDLNHLSSDDIMDALSTLYKYTEYTSNSIKMENNSPSESNGSIEITVKTSLSNMKYTRIVVSNHVRYQDIIRVYGPKITQLEIFDGKTVVMEDISTGCPHLRWLKLGYIHHVEQMFMHTQTLNFKFSMEEDEEHGHIRFSQITAHFPLLQTLYMRLAFIEDIVYNDHQEYTAQLPGSQLKHLFIRLPLSKDTHCRIIVIKETDDIISHVWTTTLDNGTLFHNEYHDSFDSVIQHTEHPTIIFKSATIETCLFSGTLGFMQKIDL